MALGAVTAARADYPSTILADSPAGYWRLGELPLTYTDIATNYGTLGAAANGLYSAYGVIHPVAGALASSGDTAVNLQNINNSRVNFGSPSSFTFVNSNSFTLELWARPTAALSGTQRLISNGSSGQGYGFSFVGNNALRMTGFGVADVTSDAGPAFAVNQWVHLALIRSNTSLYFFTNGVQFGAVKTLARIINTANPLTLGRTAANAEPFTGMLDEVAVYGTNLTPADIAAHFAAAVTPGGDYYAAVQANSPIGYWRLNEAAKPVSPTAIVNSGSVGVIADGTAYGSLNSVTGGVASVLVGDANTAMGFSGVDGKIDVPYNAGLNPAAFTVECWARVDVWSSAHQSPVTSRNSITGSQRGYILYAAPYTLTGQYTNAPRWEFWNGAGAAFSTTVSPTTNVYLGQWAHLVGTYDPVSRMKLLYVNGQIVGGNVNVAMFANDVTPLRIGAGASESAGGSFFCNGAVDEVAVFPGVLSPERVQAHYEAAAGTSPAMIAAPGIVANPVNQTNWAPYSVTLSCVATGSIPMQLQWYHISADGTATTAVPGGTNMTLVLNPTATADAGNYYLAATNSLGGAQSASAWVEIVPPTPPSLTVDLAPTVPVYVGGTAGLDCSAAGTPPITYLLQSNTVTITVSTNGFLKVPNVQPAFAATDYRVLATNVFGTATSATCKLVVLTAPVSTTAAVTTNLNPLGYWRLGEDSGNVAFDYWGGANGDYISAFPNMLPGALVDDDDGCVQVVGAGSHVLMRNTNTFNFNGASNQFSLVAWVKADAWPSTGARIFSTRLLVGNTGGYGFGIWNGNSYRFTSFGVTDIAQGLTTMNVGQWYHVAAVCSNLTVYFYLNGVYQGAGNATIATTGIKPSPYPLQLGGNPNFAAAADEEPFTGQIDEAAVFGRVLSSAEIAALYGSRYGSLVPPTIVKDPVAVQLLPGGTARFSADAIGSQPLVFQWKTNGVPVPGATETSFAIAGVTSDLNGVNCTVTVTNRAGTATSASALITVMSAPSGYTAAVVQDSPSGFWRLGEAPGSTVAYDAWGSHNGAPYGNVAFGVTPALFADADTAANFDGISPTKVEVPFAPELNTTNFSVECWVRVTGGGGSYRCPVGSRNEVQGGNQGGFIIYATDANVWSFWTGVGAGWQTLNGPAVVEGQWTHLVATYDAVTSTKRFYVNGTLVATTVQAVTPNPIRPFRIGCGQNEIDPGNYFFPGDVDEVAVYSYPLPADRVAYHYSLGKYSTTTPPFFVQQPAAQTVVVGATATLAAQVEGSPTLNYQWWKDGAPVPGATLASLVFTSAQFSDNGHYSLAATNAAGYSNSAAAKLQVMPVPQFCNLTNDLVLHLRFEGDYQDSSGRGNNGTAVGTPGFVSGKIGGQALHYATILDTSITPAYVTNAAYVSLATPADLQFSSNVNFSVACWVRLPAGALPGDLPFFGNAFNSYGNLGYVLAPAYNTGGWSWSLGNGTTYVGVYGGAATINNGDWHHLVHTFDRAGNGVTYLDGVQVDSRSITAAGDLDSGLPTCIGQDPYGTYAEGGSADIDDLGVWRHALTPYEAQSVYSVAQTYGRSFDTYGPVNLILDKSGADLELIWQAGTLEQADAVTGTWSTVPGASAPYFKVTPSEAKRFYRVRL